MTLYLALPVLLAALFLGASGFAALTRGWVLPTSRRYVRDPRRYGWGQLVVASALCWQLGFGLLVEDSGIRLAGTLSGGGMLLAGLGVMLAGQFGRGNRKGGTA
ncbi:hypothetical protein [Streptomyces sp. NPDC002490]|uniref:hypothetical protein n=1 Tax=Streptomyces sp. NPDC002490 TaxID=3154416 RepID=UPI00331AB2A7